MPSLIESLITELERPRELPEQVVSHLVGTYGLTRDAVGSFLAAELPKLEEYEVDLILSPVFTPKLQDQAVFAEILGADSIPTNQWPALIQQLVARPTRAQLVTEDGQAHSIPLREVSVARYVERLRLNGTISEPLLKLISHLPPAAERPLLKAVARRAVWENDRRCEILVRFLTATTSRETYQLDDVLELLRLVETYEPDDQADLLSQVPHWQQVLRQEINEAVAPKPFFNERVQEMHGGGRDQRRQDSSRLKAKEAEQDFLGRLQKMLAE